MTNNDELERQAFEAWFVGPNESVDSFPHLFVRRGEDYLNNVMQATWTGWQARANQESNHD